MAPTPGFLIRLDELAPGQMKGVEHQQKQILLVRLGNEVLAVDGTCPHAGGPLAEGALDRDRVICPWHKAAFCVRSGTCLEPPAVDDLEPVAIEIRNGEILLREDQPARKQAEAPGADPRCFVIVGGGGAGAVAAQTLRKEGFTGRVILIDREGALPYDRTTLSKSVLSGSEVYEKSPLQDADFYRRHAIERRHAEVAALRQAKCEVHFRDGTVLPYDAALLATGGEPLPPPFPGGDLANVFLLRSRADVDRIVAAAGGAKRAVVIGTGFIGMEAAASLSERGLEVAVVGMESEPFEKQLGARVGKVFRRLHEEKGVSFRLQRRIERLDGGDAVRQVLLDGGERIEADLVIAGLGIRPATGFIQGIALDADGGVPVDDRLRAADRLYAAGDIARFPLRGDGPPVRIEHWRVAEQQGRLAARNMLGADIAYTAVPFFWTIQYMQQLDYVGHASGADEIVVRGALEERNFIAYYLRDGRVAAAAGMGRDRDMAAIIALMERQRGWTVEALHPEDASPSEVLADHKG